PTQPFSMSILPPLGQPNEKLANALRQLSAAKYGRPRASVESEIFARLATKDTGAAKRPATTGSVAPLNPVSPGPTAPGPRSTAPTRPKGTGNSFLDEWLSKKSSPASARPVSPWSKSPSKQTPAPVSPPKPGAGNTSVSSTLHDTVAGSKATTTKALPRSNFAKAKNEPRTITPAVPKGGETPDLKLPAFGDGISKSETPNYGVAHL